MRFAYADPPYIGQSKKHYGREEVDHAALLVELRRFDGWALSCSSATLWEIARLRDGQGDFLVSVDVRVGAWVKPFCSFKPNVNPAYAWEPVLFWGGRKRGRELPTVRDWVSATPPMFTRSQRSKVKGEKPDDFSFWLFEVLGMGPGDEFVDLFPGSGAVALAWDRWRAQFPSFLSHPGAV